MFGSTRVNLYTLLLETRETTSLRDHACRPAKRKFCIQSTPPKIHTELRILVVYLGSCSYRVGLTYRTRQGSRDRRSHCFS